MLYFGPEVIMPLSSALAAVVGVAVLFWQRLVGYARLIKGHVLKLLTRLTP